MSVDIKTQKSIQQARRNPVSGLLITIKKPNVEDRYGVFAVAADGVMRMSASACRARKILRKELLTLVSLERLSLEAANGSTSHCARSCLQPMS